MNLLLLEIDGLDCIADHQLRLAEAKRAGYSTWNSSYLRRLHDLSLLAQDSPVIGAREFIDYLVEHKWRIVLLTQRLRSRPVYHATTAWLKQHGFDEYSYELVLKERQFEYLSVAAWKVMKTWWYSQEFLTGYKSIVFIDPNPHIRQEVQEQWNAFSDRHLFVYSGLTEFASHQLKHEEERKLRPYYQIRATLQETDVLDREATAEGELYDDPERSATRSTSILPLAIDPMHSSSDEVESPPLPAPVASMEGVERVHEQEHSVLEIQEEAPQNDDLLDESAEDNMAAPVQATYDTNETPLREEDAEDEEAQDEVFSQSRKQRVVKSYPPDDLIDEEERPSRKKQTKRTQRERQAHRSLKSVAELS